MTTINGQKFEAFPLTGNPYGADTTQLPGSRFSIVYIADCVFDIASFAGTYTVMSNSVGAADWGDLKVGDGVMVSAGGNEIAVFAYPYNAPLYILYPMICQVDPVTFDVTITRQIIGLNTIFSWPMIWAETGTGPGTVSPCGDAITLNMTLSAVYNSPPGGGYSGTGVLELRK